MNKVVFRHNKLYEDDYWKDIVLNNYIVSFKKDENERKIIIVDSSNNQVADYTKDNYFEYARVKNEQIIKKENENLRNAFYREVEKELKIKLPKRIKLEKKDKYL